MKFEIPLLSYLLVLGLFLLSFRMFYEAWNILKFKKTIMIFPFSVVYPLLSIILGANGVKQKEKIFIEKFGLQNMGIFALFGGFANFSVGFQMLLYALKRTIFILP